MATASLPKVIAVIFWGDDYTPISWGKYNSILGRSVTEWRIHKPNLKSESQSLFARVFRPNVPYQSQITEAQRFVIENYNRGDHVMLLDWWLDDIGGPRYTAIRQLATALTTGGSARTFESNLPSNGIPIKCIYLDFSFMETPQHAIIDKVLSDFSSTVENLLFMSSQQACVVQRGTDGRVMRKEMWLKSKYLGRAWVDWFMLQTSQIVEYNPSDLVNSSEPLRLAHGIDQPQLLSTMTDSNCTKRCRGVPCNDAIPTGGRVNRVSKVTGCDEFGDPFSCVVMSSQIFAEGEYDDAWSAPSVGPQLL